MSQIVYALMVEEQIEGEYAFMVRSLHVSEDSAKAEAERLKLSSWHHYIEPMEVLA